MDRSINQRVGWFLSKEASQRLCPLLCLFERKRTARFQTCLLPLEKRIKILTLLACVTAKASSSPTQLQYIYVVRWWAVSLAGTVLCTTRMPIIGVDVGHGPWVMPCYPIPRKATIRELLLARELAPATRKQMSQPSCYLPIKKCSNVSLKTTLY